MKGQRVTYHFLCALFILFFTTGTVLFGQARGDRVESLTEAAAGQLNVNLPLKHLHLTSSFGYRKHPLTGVGHFHEGVDLAANQDTVYSILQGTEIGRASCRERVLSVSVDLGGGRILKKKKKT